MSLDEFYDYALIGLTIVLFLPTVPFALVGWVIVAICGWWGKRG